MNKYISLKAGLKIVEKFGFDKKTVEDYLRRAIYLFPNEEVPVNSKCNNYKIPFIDGKPLMGYVNTHKTLYILRDGTHSPHWTSDCVRIEKVQLPIVNVQNFSFEDVLEFDHVTFSRSARFYMKSKRFGVTFIFTYQDAKKLISKMMRGFVAGRLMFKKHGDKYYARVVKLH